MVNSRTVAIRRVIRSVATDLSLATDRELLHCFSRDNDQTAFELVPLDPGWTFSGKLLDPDGKPLTGARGLGVSDRFLAWSEIKDSAEFTVRSFSPRQSRDILFLHPEKGLVGGVLPPKKNGGSVTVQMRPGATVTGRLLNEDGKPRAGAELKLWIRTKQHPNWEDYFPSSIQTDKDGRFRIEALVPGFDFALIDTRVPPSKESSASGMVCVPVEQRTWGIRRRTRNCGEKGVRTLYPGLF